MLNVPEEQTNYADDMQNEQEQKNFPPSSHDSSSAYARHFDEQQEILELEQNTPQLNNPIEQSVNKKALTFFGLVGLTAFGLIAYTVQLFSTPEESVQPVEQTVSIPEPELPLPLPAVQNQPVVMQQASQVEVPPIAVVQPDELQQLRQPETITLASPEADDPIESMRKSQSSLVEDAQEVVSKAQSNVAQISARHLPNRDKLLIQGTYLRCILETKIVSDIPGFTSCVITEPVYSASGKYELIPKGSKVLGQYGETNPTSGRLEVIWDRLITPTGVDVSLKSPGVDNLGAAGHEGKFQSHWGSRLASALLISMISDGFKYAGAKYGPQGTTETTNSSTITNPYESETANTLKQQAINQLERNNMRPNTVTINQGSLINIYTAQDIDFSAVVY